MFVCVAHSGGSTDYYAKGPTIICANTLDGLYSEARDMGLTVLESSVEWRNYGEVSTCQ
jgi:hypothetical protein